MRYLLDTNIISDLIRNPQSKVTAHIRRVGEDQICTSIIVAAELRYGAFKKGSSRIAQHLGAIFRSLDVLPFAFPADDSYGRLRAALERTGRPIGANDLLIAAHAMTLGCTLVTDNVREFARIDGLMCVNWLRDA